MIETDKSLVYGKLQISPESRTVYDDEQEVVITRMEFDVLYFLASNSDIAFTREQIYDAVYDGKFKEEIDNIIYCLVRSLRKKLETDSRYPEYIQTVRGAGYKFVIPEE